MRYLIIMGTGCIKYSFYGDTFLINTACGITTIEKELESMGLSYRRQRI